MTELRQPSTRRTRKSRIRTIRLGARHPRRLAAAAGLAAAAITATAVAVVMTAGTAPPGPGAGPAGTPRTAAQLLVKIADAAASQPAADVKDSDFTYIRSMDAYAGYVNGRLTPLPKLGEWQVWLPVADLCVTGLSIHDGERIPISPFPMVNGKIVRHPPKGSPQPNFTCPSEGHVGDATYRLLQSIPTQQDALLAYLKAGKRWTNDDPPTEIGDMIRAAIVPPRLAAALYRLAATLPGATLVPHATNATGQPGIGIMWTGKSAKQVYQNEWIFDRTTLQFIGEKTYDPQTGKLTGESAILQRAFTAKAGQLP